MHVLDASGGLEGRDPLQDFETVNAELNAYEEDLLAKPMLVALNKTDIPEARAESRIADNGAAKPWIHRLFRSQRLPAKGSQDCFRRWLPPARGSAAGGRDRETAGSAAIHARKCRRTGMERGSLVAPSFRGDRDRHRTIHSHDRFFTRRSRRAVSAPLESSGISDRAREIGYRVRRCRPHCRHRARLG